MIREPPAPNHWCVLRGCAEKRAELIATVFLMNGVLEAFVNLCAVMTNSVDQAMFVPKGFVWPAAEVTLNVVKAWLVLAGSVKILARAFFVDNVPPAKLLTTLHPAPAHPELLEML